MVNKHIGEENFGKSPTWEINHKFRLPDVSGRPGVKL